MTYTETKAYLISLRRKHHNMKQVCYGNGNRDRTDKCYKSKGIGVCDEWRTDFGAFYDWSVANGYELGKKLERIDKSRDFCPDNCRWVDSLDKSKDVGDTLALNLRYCRIKSGKSQIAVAKDIGVSGGVVSNWELGRTSPNVVKLRKLADYYGVDAGDLLDKNLTKEEKADAETEN